MKNSIIVEISEGLGNQLFMYAHSYALAQRKNIDLLIDDTSGFFKKKNKLRGQKYLLHHFMLEENIASSNLKVNNYYSLFVRKLMIFFDTFKNKKSFLIEKDFINKFNKNTNYSDYLNKINFKKNVHIKGNYEDELFFISNRNELKKIFTIHDKYQSTNSQLINLMKNTNSVSIHVRQNRFSDQNFMLNKISLSKKSKIFTEKNLKYIDKSIEYLNSKFNDLTYFVWSNDFNGLENYFLKYKKNKIYFVKNNNVINDFDLLKYPKYFIVGPSTFHWWGAWLNDNENKVCLCPKDINPSNNINFWPKNWIKI